MPELLSLSPRLNASHLSSVLRTGWGGGGVRCGFKMENPEFFNGNFLIVVVNFNRLFGLPSYYGMHGILVQV